jgi:outer membrane protein TolC
MRQLNLIIGQDADRRFELTDSLSSVPVTISRDTLGRDLLDRSSTLRIAQQFIWRQHSALSLARTNYLPDFTLGLFYQRRSEEPPFNQNNFNGTTSKSLGLQIGVSVPLWFWQEPKGQVQEAAALIDIAAINLSRTERSIRANILSAVDQLQTIDAQVRTFDTTLLKDAKDILSTAVAQYQNNQIDVLNLFDVYRTYRATKVEYARALSNYMIALADLESAGELPSQE